jgi:hypothetical protein
MSPLGWTTKSLRHLADELTGAGHQVGRDTVADLHGPALQAFDTVLIDDLQSDAQDQLTAHSFGVVSSRGDEIGHSVSRSPLFAGSHWPRENAGTADQSLLTV